MTDQERPSGWSGLSVFLSVAAAFLLGLFIGWAAHGFMMYSMMDRGMMGGGMMGKMMNGPGMSQGGHAGMMNTKSGRKSGMMRMMDRMMSGRHCPMMMRAMMDQMQSMSGMSPKDMDQMLNTMDPEAMRQHCRSMRATMMEIMRGERKGAGEPSQTLEQMGWLDETDREWIQSIRGRVTPKDFRGQHTVTIKVGAGENGLRFQPAVVRVDRGTTVRFEWTGRGGSHNVDPLDLDQASPLQYQQGVTYKLTIEEAGSYRYVCHPHQVVGMKGLIIVE